MGAIANNQLTDEEAASVRDVLWDREKGLGLLNGKSILAIALIGIAAGTVAAWAITRGLLT